MKLDIWQEAETLDLIDLTCCIYNYFAFGGEPLHHEGD